MYEVSRTEQDIVLVVIFLSLPCVEEVEYFFT